MLRYIKAGTKMVPSPKDQNKMITLVDSVEVVQWGWWRCHKKHSSRLNRYVVQTEKLSRVGSWRVSESPSFARKWRKLLADGDFLLCSWDMRDNTWPQFLKKNLCCRRYISSKSEISIERHNQKDSSVNMIAASFLEEQPQEYLAKMLQQPE